MVVGWMDRWTDERMMDGRMVDGWMDIMKEERMTGQKDGQKEGRKQGQEEEKVGG